MLSDELYAGSNHAELLNGGFEQFAAVLAVRENSTHKDIRKNFSVELRGQSVHGLVEKPVSSSNGLLGCGTYVLSRRVFEVIERRLAGSLPHSGDLTGAINELIAAGQSGTFDFAFVDAGNKDMYVDYYEACLKLLRRGGIVAVDNTLNRGLVFPDADLSGLSPERRNHVHGVRRFNAHVHKDERVALAMLGISDGLTLARKR